MQPSPENITELAPDEVFVFGSNLAGRHGAGAALLAMRQFGAVYGQGEGAMGRSYALPTKDRRLRVLPLAEIEVGIVSFLGHARRRPAATFMVTQVGCGLAHYTPAEIAPLFGPELPANVRLPASFIRARKASAQSPGSKTHGLGAG